MVLLRFAPSPTGALHLGGLRTALYNHLYARKLGGKWILRIEDTDATRYVPGAVEGIRGALAWAGLIYDHGPGLSGPHGPYFQSERLDLYHSYTNKLLDKRVKTGSNATYDKACLHLTEEEVARRDDNLPDRTTPTDIVFGTLKDAHASLPTDPVLLKSDLFPTYHLASVVDDHEMGITHVLRGEEWLPSLPLHLDLYSCLSLTPPHFAHLPILLNPDGTKMSKRKGDVQVIDFMRRGWEPGAVLNWLALSGWGVQHDHAHRQFSSNSDTTNQAPDSTTLMTLSELIDQFDLSSLTHRRNVLDPAKLNFLNKHHLISSWQAEGGITAHATRLHDLVKTSFPTSQYTTVGYIAQVIRALQGRIVNLLDVPALAPFFFVDPDYTTDEAKSMIRVIPASDYRTAVDAVAVRLRAETETLQTPEIGNVLHDEGSKVNIKSKQFMTALRHALTGMKSGPSVPEIIEVLGIERAAGTLTRARNIGNDVITPDSN
ncbi:hypothetical protein BJ138DRAFT_1216266 [Hygrophoropsis aurantiaca]|uniref:Uncharacterized protein n=1 Tax=Hygrophoropsis aurantiaca TaxID=72124 RepID=A0ACB8A335_9AGAM|nr:hypothetical protein BJ138DRAFT_1216266 [Hygrophoropsis aurantiaca]